MAVECAFYVYSFWRVLPLLQSITLSLKIG